MQITGSTLQGDQVRLDWSDNGGASTRVSCGPWTVQTDGSTDTSAAKRTYDYPHAFRACGKAVFYLDWVCTNWWWTSQP